MRKNPWLEKSIENILPLSQADDFKKALNEWSFTGDVIDHGSPVEKCELCEHEELRYHYEIKNLHAENSLWVGSSCILRFEEINVYDEDGNLLTDDKEREELLRKAIKDKQVDMLLEPLREFWRKDKSYRLKIQSMVEHFKSKGGFEPMDLAKALSRMKTLNLDYDVKKFPLYLRTDTSRFDLYRMDNDLFSLIEPCLSSAQRKRFEKLISAKMKI